MKLRYLYILISFLISSNLSTDDVYDTSWALVIGINNYEFIEDLPYSVDDAIAIKNMLINHYDFPRENVTVLLDGDADAYKIKKELGVFIFLSSISSQLTDLQESLRALN